MNKIERYMQAEQACQQANVKEFEPKNRREYPVTAMVERNGSITIMRGGVGITMSYEDATQFRTWLNEIMENV